jgi:hypothetical protein
MVKISANASEFAARAQSLYDSFNQLNVRLTGAGIAAKVWPKLKEKLINHLRQNVIDLPNMGIETGKRWRGFKSKLIQENVPVSHYPGLFLSRGFDYTTVRELGGAWLPIVSDESWKATGYMEQHLLGELDEEKISTVVTESAFDAEIEVDVSMLEDEYPITVDEQLMAASGGDIGLIRLFEWQEKELYEMLISETENISKDLFGE